MKQNSIQDFFVQKKRLLLVALVVLFNLINSFAQTIPTISNFYPKSGIVGSSVTITGSNFNTTAENNVVFFGATRALVTAAASNSLTVTVPTGATYSEITLFNGSLATSSSNKFTPTFSSSFDTITANDFDPKMDLVAGVWPYQVALGDIDGDGKSDLVVANRSSYSVSIFRNISTPGAITFAPKVDFTTAQEPRGLNLCDIDGDGKLDISTTGGNLNQVAVTFLLNTSTVGNLSFAPGVQIDTNLATYSVVSSDVDLDGKIDIIFGGQVLKVFHNTSTPGVVSFDTPVDFPSIANSTDLQVGDFDGDGKKDFCVTNGYTLQILKNSSTNGTIALDTVLSYNLYYAVGLNVSDFDGDGKLDIATTLANNTNSMRIFTNTSTGGSISFANPTDFSTPQNPYGIASGDLNGDGKVDVVTSNAGHVGTAANLSVFQNASNPAINFNSFVNLNLGTWPYYVTVGDIDGDGFPDIVSSSVEASKVSVFRAHPLSRNADLMNLITSAGNLSPAFNVATTSYSSVVDSSINSIMITPTVSNASSTIQIQVNGGGYSTIASGTASSSYSLNIGNNTIQIKVTSQYGTEKTYTITVNRQLTVPTISNFTIPNKVLGDASFTLTTPISNSTGAFTYSSSNTSVATINGTTVTIVGGGTTVITAIQAPIGLYTTGVITANLVVSFPAPLIAAPTPTVPADRVLSLYSNAYTNVSGTDWFLNTQQTTIGSDIQIAGNDTKKYEFLDFQRVQFANPINASSMTSLHIDIWTPNASSFKVFLINNNTVSAQQSVTLNPSNIGWNSFDIPLSQYTTIDMSNINQLMFMASPSGTTTAYLDNLYFTKPTPTVVPPTVTAIVNVCKGATPAPLTATAHVGNTLKWYTVGGTATAPTYTLISSGAPSPATTTVASPSKVYAVSEVYSNGVESSKSKITVSVLALPTTPTTLTGTAAQGTLVGTTTTATYTTTAVTGATSYFWTVPAGVNIISGQGTTSVLVNFNGVSSGAGTIGSISVQAVNANGCTSVAKSLTLTKALPLAPTTLTMTDGVNSTSITSFAKYMGTPTVLKLNTSQVATATSYEWELPVGVNRTDGIGTNSTTPYIYVNFTGVTKANTLTGVSTNILRIGVKAKNGVGVSTTNNAALTNPTTTSTAKLLTLNAVVPAAVTTVTGATSGLCGGKTYTYTITDTALASSYAVTAPAGAAVNYTNNNLVFTVTYPIGFTINGSTSVANKSLVITSVNGIGSSVSSKTLTLSTTIPSIGTINGGTTYSSCNQTFSTPEVSGATQYTWIVPIGASIVSGQGTNSVVVNYGTLSGNQSLLLIATNDCGVYSPIKAITLTPGACPLSKEIENDEMGNSISIYPNPVKEEFNIELNSLAEGQIQMELYTINGVLISSKNITLNEGTTIINENSASLTSGMYLIKLTNNSTNEIIIKKIIKE